MPGLPLALWRGDYYGNAIAKRWYRCLVMTLLERVSRLWRTLRNKLGPGSEVFSGEPDSSAWPMTQASVYSVNPLYRARNRGLELWYEYHAEGNHWSGSLWMPFADEDAVEAYAAAHPPGSPILIRYCPGDAGRSVMFEADQMAHVPPASPQSS